MSDGAELELLRELREQLLAEAIEAERQARSVDPFDRYYTGRMDAFSLALVLVDNMLDG